MQRQIYSTLMRGDVYKTVFTNKGILMYFSVPLSTKFDTTDVETSCNLLITDFCYNSDYVYGINKVELFNGQPVFDDGDSKKFFELHPEGFKIEKARVLCII